MATTTLDITGVVCPYCILSVKKAADKMQSGDVLAVRCDHPPAATGTIPAYAKTTGMEVDSKKIESGLWELRLTKK